MMLYREKTGVISDKPVWICFHRFYMYSGDTLLLLILDMIKNWNHERKIIG